MRGGRSRSSRVVAGTWVGLLLALTAGPGQAGAPPFWPVVRASSGITVPVTSGVSYSHYTVATSAGPLSIHHLRVDLGNPSVRLDVGLARNQLISADETVSSMVHRTGAVAGVNGDYFDIGDSGMPLNIVVQDGRLLRSPSRWAALGITRNGGVRIGRFRWAGSVVLAETGESYWLAGLNTGLVRDGLVLLSNVRGYGAPVPEPGVRQTVVELNPAHDSSGGLFPAHAAALSGSADEGRYTAMQVWPQQAYYAPFPAGTILLVGRGGAADWLRRKVTAGMPVQVNLTTAPDWHDLRGAIGGGPLLVLNGQIVNDPVSPVPGERDQRNPVTAAGLLRDGRTLLLVEVDGRQPRLSIGLTQPQLAAYMRWLGAYQAMEFDSGGSATMVVRLPGRAHPTVMNSPSDGRERPVGDALLVYSAATANRSPR